MKFTVDKNLIVRRWPRLETYQNSTLRYTPPKNFPAHWAEANGRMKIIRSFITLDEVWDYRTDEYMWNYRIGVNRYESDPNHFSYDWNKTVPSQTYYEDYLTSYCACADEVIFNIRRYERETADGLISYEKYEEVVEKVISHYKALCTNIKYIEVSNESELNHFGDLTVAQYIKLYDCICRVANRLSKNYDEPLMVGGRAMGTDSYFRQWREYLEALVTNRIPERRIDFYSMHSYTTDNSRMQHMYNLHKAAVAELSLPDAPIFFDEYGSCRATGIPEDSLKNAVGTLTGMMRSSDMPGLYVFPWCTFHNPKLQISYTQYLHQPDGSYVPTPNGQAMTMLHLMLRDELLVIGDTKSRVRATGDGDATAVIVTNPDSEPLEFQCTVNGFEKSDVWITAYQVDAERNNCVTGVPCNQLSVTAEFTTKSDEKGLEFLWTLPPHGFVLFHLK